MSTLDDPHVRAACRERIRLLDPNASPATSLLQTTLIKWIALRAPLRWPPGVPTRPEIEQGRGGTPPAEWENDHNELLGLLESFADRQKFGAHPVFGPMSRCEWLTWGYRHVDHHLRQFGV